MLGTHNLGYLHDMGLGVPRDRRKGADLHLRAADMGWAESMWNLANMYGAGQLGGVDLFTACIWTHRAQRFANPSQQALASQTRQVAARLQKMLPAGQIAACKQQADDWQPKSAAPPKPAG